MTAALRYDPIAALRAGVESLVTAHIDAFLVAKGYRLARGTSAGAAKDMVRKWSPKALEFFWVMANREDDGQQPFPSRAEIARSLGWSEPRLHDFWSKTLGAASIRVKDDHGGEGRQRVFRRRRERKFSSDGIALFLGMDQPSYASVLRIVTSTGAMTAAVDDNMQGAIEAAETNEALTVDERSEPRKKFLEREAADVRGPQLALISSR